MSLGIRLFYCLFRARRHDFVAARLLYSDLKSVVNTERKTMKESLRRIVPTLILGLAVGLGIAAPARAQSQATTGEVGGRVVDAQGAVVPGVTVTVKSPNTGLQRTAVTDQEGLFSIAAAAAGLIRAPLRAVWVCSRHASAADHRWVEPDREPDDAGQLGCGDRHGDGVACRRKHRDRAHDYR